MARIERTTQANLDLLEIYNYYAEQRSADAAERMLRSIADTCEQIAAMPGMGRSREELAPGLRSFPSGSYILYYRPLEDGIRLLRVLHGARNIEDLFPGSDAEEDQDA
jgi:toxin ParE1/3/4